MDVSGDFAGVGFGKGAGVIIGHGLLDDARELGEGFVADERLGNFLGAQPGGAVALGAVL